MIHLCNNGFVQGVEGGSVLHLDMPLLLTGSFACSSGPASHCVCIIEVALKGKRQESCVLPTLKPE